MNIQLQQLLLPDEKDEALRMSQRYLEGAPVRDLAKEADLSKAKTLLRIMAVNGAETMKDKMVKTLKRQHRQNCRCHAVRHIIYLTMEERSRSFDIYERYINGATIQEMAKEQNKAKDRIMMIVAAGYGLKNLDDTVVKTLRARHNTARQKVSHSNKARKHGKRYSGPPRYTK